MLFIVYLSRSFHRNDDAFHAHYAHLCALCYFLAVAALCLPVVAVYGYTSIASSHDCFGYYTYSSYKCFHIAQPAVFVSMQPLQGRRTHEEQAQHRHRYAYYYLHNDAAATCCHYRCCHASDGKAQYEQVAGGKFQQQAQKCPTKFLYAALRLLNNCEINYRQSSSKRLLTELTLIEVAQLTQEDEDVPGSGRRPARRLKTLFKKLAAAVSPKSVSQVTEAKKPETNDKQATTGQLPPQNVPTPKKKINLKESLISLKNLNKKEETKEEEELLINQDEQNKFTQDDLEKAWYAMCSRMPRQMTATAMRLKNIVPRIGDYPNIELVIDNQLLIDEITPIKGRIQATMAKDLHNGSINFTLRLAEIGETKIALTKKEQLEDMKKSYSPIKKLSDALQLEII